MATAVASAYSDPDKEIISHYKGEVRNNFDCEYTGCFFRSARTSCTTFGWFVRPVRKKNLDHLYTGI